MNVFGDNKHAIINGDVCEALRKEANDSSVDLIFTMCYVAKELKRRAIWIDL